MPAPAAIPPVGIPAGFATRLHWPLTGDARLLTDAIEALTEFAVGREPLDARIFRALGWQVERRIRRGRPSVWWVKSPYSATWHTLPRPSVALTDTRRLVPDGWSWGTGMRGGHAHGWVSARHPIREGVPFFECNGLSPELALTKAALFARRHLAMKTEGLL